MSPVVLVTLAAGFALALFLVGFHAFRLARGLEAAERRLASSEAGSRALAVKLTHAEEEDKKKIGWLDNQEKEITWLREEMERRPRIARKTYRILTLGVKATGKTSLTLKWANPLTDLGTLEGTKIERYERTVSHVSQEDLVTEHVFEVHDWGGEHLVDAQHELITEEIHGLLIVVDLGAKDARAIDPDRVREQHQEFLPQVLKYLFGPKTVASCKTVVLFINKSDLLAGTPAEVEEQARKLYGPLIENLNRFSTQIDVRVFVGSASYGHSTHRLFSHFVEKILPKNAYDHQLLQRMKSDLPPARAPAPSVDDEGWDEQTSPLANGHPSSPAVDAAERR
jgi:ADP-ribosylation factor family